jgi:periplasmic copper chaperone A
VNVITRGGRRLPVALSSTAIAALVLASGALAHARISPPVSLSKELQLFSLAVPTEKEGAKTTKIVLTVPSGFSIDSFVPSPGWQRVLQQTGSGEDAVIQKVTWTGGSVPTGEDSTFWFLAQPSSSGTYTFQVQQTYSDGSIVDWNGSESAENPAPTIEAKASLGGGGTPLLTIIALVVGAVGLILGAVALFAGGGKRQLA